ncbi:uncharacterized protein LOC128558815 [Mercenaria mercenaria]|uniref:uncharacterized protein LOC128558815 n=1 Tax=Mercenaria mercenaria TaxID=6596 RepID=UPI00234EF59C|nr:uncharacterized protein LOC128558815 [Mercenaria mercenaria]
MFNLSANDSLNKFQDWIEDTFKHVVDLLETRNNTCGAKKQSSVSNRYRNSEPELRRKLMVSFADIKARDTANFEGQFGSFASDYFKERANEAKMKNSGNAARKDGGRISTEVREDNRPHSKQVECTNTSTSSSDLDKMIEIQNNSDLKIQKQVLQTPLKTHDTKIKTSLNVGNIKMSLQYFPSVCQLRIGLFDIGGIPCDNREMVVHIFLIDNKNKTLKKCVSKTVITESNRATFNEDIYFQTKRKKFYECHLKIELCKLSRRLRRAIPIGKGLLQLYDLSLVLDTTVHVTLSQEKVVNADEVNVSEKRKSVEVDPKEINGTSCFSPDTFRRVNSLPLYRRYAINRS